MPFDLEAPQGEDAWLPATRSPSSPPRRGLLRVRIYITSRLLRVARPSWRWGAIHRSGRLPRPGSPRISHTPGNSHREREFPGVPGNSRPLDLAPRELLNYTRRGALTACPNCRTVSRVDPVMPVAAFSIGDRVSALWGHKWFPGIVDGVIIGQTRRRRSVSTRPTSVCSSTIRRVRHGVRRSRHGLRVHCRQKSASALRRRILALFGGM